MIRHSAGPLPNPQRIDGKNRMLSLNRCPCIWLKYSSSNILSLTLTLVSLIVVACYQPSPMFADVIVGAQATYGSSNDVVTLTRLDVNRNGSNVSYTVGELTTGTISAINLPGGARRMIIRENFASWNGAPNGFLNDPVLTRGMWTPGKGNDGVLSPGEEFTEYTFAQPIVNGRGTELLFGFISARINDSTGAPGPYWISADGAAGTLISRPADFAFPSTSALSTTAFFSNGVTSPSDFLQTTVQHQPNFLGGLNRGPIPSLQLIDLTDLGVPENASINAIRFWDDGINDPETIHPTYIAAFPALSAVPEPSTAGLLLCAFGLPMLRRIRRTDN